MSALLLRSTPCHAAESQGDSPQLSAAAMAAMVRCLANAPRLAQLDWGAPCHHLLTLATTAGWPNLRESATARQATETGSSADGGGKSDLAAACVLLALKHGGVASLGLGDFLDKLMTQHKFGQLPSQFQQNLLVGLPEVLNALSSRRAAAVATTLSTLGSNFNFVSRLSTAAWTGLARLMLSTHSSDSSTAVPPAAVTQAANGAVEQLLQKLPLPPFLLPGEQLPQLSMNLDAAIHATMTTTSASATGIGSKPEQNADAQQRQAGEEEEEKAKTWGAACACLQLMPIGTVSNKMEKGSDKRLSVQMCKHPMPACISAITHTTLGSCQSELHSVCVILYSPGVMQCV